MTFEEGAPVNDRFNEVFSANTVRTYHLGAEMKMNGGFTIFARVPPKKATVKGGRNINGLAYSLGVDHWEANDNLSLFSLQYDFISGEDSSDGSYDAFINPWEGTSAADRRT